MISELRSCSPTELRDQIAYLLQTPVAGIASLLQERRCCLKAGTVRSRLILGRLKTEFGQIGNFRAPHQDGQAKFRVADVLPLLEANPGADDAMLGKIRKFMQEDERGAVVFNTTLMNLRGELIVKDGNKRTIAFFERRRRSEDEIAFQVFLVEPTHGYGV